MLGADVVPLLALLVAKFLEKPDKFFRLTVNVAKSYFVCLFEDLNDQVCHILIIGINLKRLETDISGTQIVQNSCKLSFNKRQSLFLSKFFVV